MNAGQLAKIMADRDLSTRDIAEACDVTQDAVRKWLRGERNISKQMAFFLMANLGDIQNEKTLPR